MLSFDALELDGNLFSGDDVSTWKASAISFEIVRCAWLFRTQVDITEATTADLATDAVFVADTQVL